jgi:hypothetical protein
VAPTKPPVSSAADGIIAPSLSLPVSSLWAHQLRREYSALLARIKDHASALGNVSAVQLDKIAAQATRAENKSSELNQSNRNLRKSLQDKARERGKALEEELRRASRRLEVSEQTSFV